jgi:hypothetical protein
VFGQIIIDFDPRHFGANKHVKLGAHARIIVQKSRRNAYRREVWSRSGYGRTTHTAKMAKTARGCFKALDQMLASQQSVLVSVDVHITGYMRAAQFPAIAAMTEG